MVIKLKELEILHTAQSGSEKEKILGQEEKKLTGWEAVFEKNMRAKTELARELADMGLSKEAVERILHIKSKGVRSREQGAGSREQGVRSNEQRGKHETKNSFPKDLCI